MIIGPWDDVAVVPAVAGLTVRDAIDYAGWAKVGIGRSPDGPPLESLVYPCDEFVVTSQTPPPGTRLRRYETGIVEWSPIGGDGAGVREPRRPSPPTLSLKAARELLAEIDDPSDQTDASLTGTSIVRPSSKSPTRPTISGES